MEDEKMLESSWKARVRAKDRKFVALRLDIIAIQKEYQKRGYGMRLLATAIDDFYQIINMTGIPAMILTCSEKVDIDFYAQFGFARYGREVTTPRMFLPSESVIKAYADTAGASVY
jgi:GNAT superfamily N-acetyltransferase